MGDRLFRQHGDAACLHVPVLLVCRTLCSLRRLAGVKAVRLGDRQAFGVSISRCTQAVPQRRLPLPARLLRQAIEGSHQVGAGLPVLGGGVDVELPTLLPALVAEAPTGDSADEGEVDRRKLSQSTMPPRHSGVDGWRGPLLEKREKRRTPRCFSANDSRPERYTRRRCGPPASFFRPAGAGLISDLHPWLAPWAAFLRR